MINSEEREKSTYKEENQSKGKRMNNKDYKKVFLKQLSTDLKKTLRREFVKLTKLTQDYHIIVKLLDFKEKSFMYPSKENKGKKISQLSDVLTAMAYARRK